MSTIYVFNYNNYYNRRLKKESSIVDYGDAVYIETSTNYNFNPNDGVTTRIVLGRPGRNNYSGKGDYVIYSENNVDITSRWFIIEQNRTMGNQYDVSLYRDVMADYWDLIKESDCFIEKAILPDNNPLIFNQENMSVNQIKKSETLLKDDTGCPWIVAYYDRSKTISGTVTPKHNYDISVPDAFAWVNDNSFKYLSGNADNLSFVALYNTPMSGNIRMGVDLNTNNFFNQQNSSSLIAYQVNPQVNTSAFNKADMFANFNTDTENTYKDNNTAEAFRTTYNGAILFQNALGNEAYYRINISNSTTQSTTIAIDSNKLNYNYIEQRRVNYTGLRGTANDNSYIVTVQYNTLVISLTRLYQDEEITYSVDNSCYDLQDAPYRMLCMPYGNVTEKFNNITYTANKELNFRIASAMQDDGAIIYDIQIVPYCPLNEEFIGDGFIDAGNDSILAHPIKQHNTILGYIYSCSQSSFSRHISFDKTIGNVKVENQCDMYRLCSPNYAGVFEFNAAKNAGIKGFDISCTYKPFQPYIHVNPDFQMLYGTDFGDNRGLICGGDFSLAKVSNAFNEYALNNKNFQTIFDREIQNMEVSHKYDMIQSAVGATAGAIGSGASAGILTGNRGVGIAAGAISAIGGIADLAIKENLYNEALDYKKDMFGYHLDNIKAMPQSLSRTTAYNNDNKYFPFLEFYTCTDEEKKAFAQKIAWNSMTVGVIGKLEIYIGNNWTYDDIEDKGYIKASLIRLEGVEDDTHLLNAIADELYKGVYTK